MKETEKNWPSPATTTAAAGPCISKPSRQTTSQTETERRITKWKVTFTGNSNSKGIWEPPSQELRKSSSSSTKTPHIFTRLLTSLTYYLTHKPITTIKLCFNYSSSPIKKEWKSAVEKTGGGQQQMGKVCKICTAKQRKKDGHCCCCRPAS